jgi:tRNA-2-methylthio-N6-dimethylallyladenosine synthase
MKDPAATEEGLSPMPGSGLLHEDRTFHIETYGCQMNVADSDVVRAVMRGAGYSWAPTTEEADIVFLNTCAIRDNAEKRVWGRLGALKGMRRQQRGKVVGLLGCMAERLKTRLLEEEAVDLVAGPDAYRDLPALLRVVSGGEKAANVQLSLDETYADIKPVRVSDDRTSAFVSVVGDHADLWDTVLRSC